MWFKLSQLILRNRGVIITIIALLTIVFGYYALTSLETDNRYGNTLPKDSPAQKDYQKLIKMFGNEGGSLVIAIQTDSLYTESNFLKWKELGDSISSLGGVESVFSEADLFQLINNTEKKKFEIEPIFQDTTYTTKSIEEIKKEVRSVPLYHGILYNDSSNVSLMMVNISAEYLNDQDKQDVVLNIENIAQQYEPALGRMHFAGLPHIRVILGNRVISEMYIFIGLAIFVTSLLLYIFFRSFRIVMICNLVVFIAVIWALGSIGMMGFKLSILMALIPPLMIVIGIPDCIYLLNKFHQEVRDHGNKIKALSRVIQRIGNATFMTNLTTAIGFSTFIFTNSEKLMEFGVAASLNIMIVFVLSICIIPIVFSYSGQPKKRHLKHLEQKFSTVIVEKLVYLTINHRNRIYAITLIVVAIGIWGGTKMRATGNLTSDLPDSDPIVKDMQFIQKNFGGVIPFEILVNYKENGRKFDQQLLQKIETIQQELAADTVFSKSISIVDFLKVINMAYYGNNPYMYKLVKPRDMLRLKEYAQKFKKGALRKRQIHIFQDSIKEGNLNYADSIMLISPKIAGKVMAFKPQKVRVEIVPKADSLENKDSLVYTLQEFPTSLQIHQFLAKEQRPEKVLVTSQKIYPTSSSGLSIKDLVDTANTTYRIRMEMKDLGSYQVADIIKGVSTMLDTVLNPNFVQAMVYYQKFKGGEESYADSIFNLSSAYRNNVTFLLANGNDSLLFQFDLKPELLASYYGNSGFKETLKKSIHQEKLSYIITGTSVVVAEGTEYLIYNMFTSIIIAIIVISLLMALLFRSWKMVAISMAPNLIPLIMTAGIMGFFRVPIKPSTLLVFSIALGISVDSTIHFLTKYRHEFQRRGYNQKACIIEALRETGISMLYTSMILFCGFSMFAFSSFGGTKALGLLISLTLLIAALTNLILVPSLLLSIENRTTLKAFKEPLIDVYDEETDVEMSHLRVLSKKKKENPKIDNPKTIKGEEEE